MNDNSKNNWIGQPLDRVDGPAKVSGEAMYAEDYRPPEKAAIGYIVEAPAGPGKLTLLDTGAALAAEGVLFVLTHENAPKQEPYASHSEDGRFTQSHALLEGPQVRHYGAPVALVVAETFEQARHAAGLIKIEIEAGEAVYVAEDHRDRAKVPDDLDGGDDSDSDKGDFLKSFGTAPVTLDIEYHTPNQHAAAMEPHATTAEWDGEKLTVHMSIQIIGDARKGFANTLGIDKENVRIVSPFIGGGFGSKLGIHNEAVLAALAAKKSGRPVRVVQTRRNLFANGPHRSKHWQRIRLGATREGRLQAVGHESLAAMAKDYPFAEPAVSPTRASYQTDALMTRQRVVAADIPKVDSMRAPGEAVGTLTYETAIDEMAEKCGVDPVEFRLSNAPGRDPASGKPFSDRRMEECLRVGAEQFGWESGRPSPGAKREGNFLVGRGVAAAIRPNNLQKAMAEISLGRDGRFTARLDMTDIGTGTYTILTQIAAETLGVEPGRVTVLLGDSDFPETCGSGGSFGAGSTGSALLAACKQLKSDLLVGATAADPGWLGLNSADLAFEGETMRAGPRSIGIAELVSAGDRDSMTAKGAVEPGEDHEKYKQYSYGALFAEVGVDVDSGEIRLRRLLGVFSAGRILNAKTARSQLMGGMIFGVGAALMEESLMDTRFGAFMNRDLAEYHIPVNRDVPRLEVTMLDDHDARSNPMGSKGIGELGICGAGPAIANAIHDATGFRVRHFPIHLEDLLPHLPQRA